MNNRITNILLCTALALGSCSGKSANSDTSSSAESETITAKVTFNADSAYRFVAQQTEFGPRVPGTEAHRRCAAWMAETLRGYGFDVTEQRVNLRAFDGTMLPAVNVFGSINPEAKERTMLVAHWDSRPWADNDPDEANHKKPVMGANDGASGVGVILEIARLASQTVPQRGIDVLFVDAEDWGTEGDDTSWAMGARHYVENPVPEGFMPSEVILLDMVGGKNARFYREYHSQRHASGLVDRIWSTAAASGYGSRFVNRLGGVITDDHVEFLKVGIPAIDIIEYNEGADSGFNPTWHTVHDTLENIDPETLKAVGQTLSNYLF